MDKASQTSFSYSLSLLFSGLIPKGSTPKVLFFFILLFGLVLRLQGIDYGLPLDNYHMSLYETETETFEYIQDLDMLHGDFVPRGPRPAAFNAYVGHMLLVAASALGICHFSLDLDYYRYQPRELRKCFLVLRAWMVLLALLCMIFVFGTGRMVGGMSVGLLAMSIVAITPIHFTESHFYTHHLRLGTYVAAVCYVAATSLRYRDRRLEILVAILSGFAIGTIINGGFCFSALLFVVLANRPADKSIVRTIFSVRSISLACLGFAVHVMLVGGQWVNWQQWFHHWTYLQDDVFYRDPENITAARALTVTIPFAYGFILYAGMVFGIIWNLIYRDKMRWLMLAVLAIPMLAILLFPVARARYMLHILPMVSVLVAMAVIEAPKKLPRFQKLVTATLMIVLLGGTFVYTFEYAYLIRTEPFTRTASKWIDANIPADAKIGLIHEFRRGYPEVFNEGYYGLNEVHFSNVVAMDKLWEEQGNKIFLPKDLDYIVTMDLELLGIYQKYWLRPEEYPERNAFIRELFSGVPYKEIKVFETEPLIFKKWMKNIYMPLDMGYNTIVVRVFKRQNETSPPSNPIEP